MAPPIAERTLESSLDEKPTSESWAVMLPVAAAAKERLPWMGVLGCPWKLVTIVSKLIYNLFTRLTTYLYRVYNPFTKFQLGIQS